MKSFDLTAENKFHSDGFHNETFIKSLMKTL